MADFFNDVTGGDLLLWKSVLATIVFLLAGWQVLWAARLWGAARFPRVSEQTAARIHRVSGRVVLIGAFVVALACVTGPAGATSPTRVVLHSIAGIAVLVVIVAKLAILRVVRKGDRALPALGILLFLFFAATWATSVADYVTRAR